MDFTVSENQLYLGFSFSELYGPWKCKAVGCGREAYTLLLTGAEVCALNAALPEAITNGIATGTEAAHYILNNGLGINRCDRHREVALCAGNRLELMNEKLTIAIEYVPTGEDGDMSSKNKWHAVLCRDWTRTGWGKNGDEAVLQLASQLDLTPGSYQAFLIDIA